MKIQYSLCSSLAAYLRQAELSVHRAESIAQLADFFANRSVMPRVVISVIVAAVGKSGPVETVDWRLVSHRSQSFLYLASLRIRSVFRRSERIALAPLEASAIIEILQKLDEMLSNTPAPSEVELNKTRQRLYACSELLLQRINDPDLRSHIGNIEHLNAASHLKVMPIQEIKGWSLISGKME